MNLPKNISDKIQNSYDEGAYTQVLDEIEKLNGKYNNSPVLLNFVGAAHQQLGNIKASIEAFQKLSN